MGKTKCLKGKTYIVRTHDAEGRPVKVTFEMTCNITDAAEYIKYGGYPLHGYSTIRREYPDGHCSISRVLQK